MTGNKGKVVNGRWEIAGEKWQVANGRWKLTGGKWQVATVHGGSRYLFKILLNQPEIRLYLLFSIDLEQQTDTVRLLFEINRKMVNTI